MNISLDRKYSNIFVVASSYQGMSVSLLSLSLSLSLLPVNVNIAASAFYCLIFFAMNEKHRAVVIGLPRWK